MTREEAWRRTKGYLYDALSGEEADEIIEALEQEQSGDLISRQAVNEIINDIRDCISVEGYWAILERLKKLPPVRPQEPKTEQFAKWVASEIFDEMWEYNKDSFAEIACRKLAKLGIVRAKGDEWELVEPQKGAKNDKI